MKRQLEIRPRVSCPNCWAELDSAAILWVSAHPDLRGDQYLGEDALQRFLPSRFDAGGFALDANGLRCQSLACPKCHLIIPRILVEVTPLFVSVIGAPSSGKSYFLASCIWETRQRLRDFRVAFTDADPVANQIISGYEQKLFLNDQPDDFVAIPKTEEEGELYQSVNYGSHAELYARPFVFSMRPNDDHALISAKNIPLRKAARALCLYDNAGEHFQASAQSELSPATDHLSLSEALLFVFDPLQHPSFRRVCRELSSDPQLNSASMTHRQDEILLEAAKRIRQKSNLPEHEKVKKPLVVVINKYDVWGSMLKGVDLAKLPIYPQTPDGVRGINADLIRKVSDRLHKMLLEFAPEFVAACENFCDDVTYIPCSPQGCSPEENPVASGLGVRPGQLSPLWAEVPLLYAIAKANCALMPQLNSASDQAKPTEKTNESGFQPRLYGAG